MKYFLFILGILLCLAYESYSEEVMAYTDNLVTEVIEGPRPLNAKALKKMSGRYVLERMRIRDTNFYDEIVFDPVNTRAFSEEFFNYGGSRSKFEINPKKTYLEINEKNICTFNWELKLGGPSAKSRSFNVTFSKSGSKRYAGCLKEDRTLDSPMGLMPRGQKTFQKLSASTLVLRAKDKDVEQVLYYRKVIGDEHPQAQVSMR